MRLTDAAFEGAVERYGDTVFRLAYSYLKNRADAEDVMQETLLKLYLERKPFRSPGLWRRPGSRCSTRRSRVSSTST